MVLTKPTRTLCVMLLLVYGAAKATEAPRKEGVRKPARAGQWYKADPAALRRELEVCFAKARPQPKTKGRLLALVQPHAGFAFSGPTAAWGCKLIKKGQFKRVIALGPSHYSGFRGASITASKYYETPLGLIPVDRRACDELLKNPLFRTVEKAHEQEHSIEAQLPFLQTRLGGDWKLIPVLFSRLHESGGESRKIAEALAKYVDDGTLILASSDFTHYGPNFRYVPFRKDVPANIRRLDFGAIGFIRKRDCAGFLGYCASTGATICGRLPIAVLLKLLPENSKGELLKYTSSGEVLGDYRNSVSYASIGFFSSDKPANDGGADTDSLKPEEEQKLLALARNALELFVKDGKTMEIEPADYPSALRRRSGVFVTLKKGGRLRGCIGYVVGRAPIVTAVRDNAINAASRDPRFKPVKTDELKDIRVEISVMSSIRWIDDPEKVIVGRHGVILKCDGRTGLLLPQVAVEHNLNRRQFLDAVCRKAGVKAGKWRTGEIFVFRAQVFGEEPGEPVKPKSIPDKTSPNELPENPESGKDAV